MSAAYRMLQALDEQLPSFELVSLEEQARFRSTGIIWQ